MYDKIEYQLLEPIHRTKSKKRCIYYLSLLLLIITTLFICILFVNMEGLSEWMYSEVHGNKSNMTHVYQRRPETQQGLSEKMYSGLHGNKSNMTYIYRRRPETQHIDCARIIRNDKDYIKQISGKNRVKMVKSNNLEMTCSHISDRIIPSMKLRDLSSGIAFARIVYTDYELIEHQIRSSYHPQNVFCFAIDKKADKEFHMNMKSLASCIPNVILLFEEKIVDSDGHNVNQAHYDCLKILIHKPGWNYVILLQNHDMIGKSVYEMERIYQLLGGANDVDIEKEVGVIDRQKFKWTPESLKLFRNSENVTHINNKTLYFAKGLVQVSLSRAAVEWMVLTTDLTTFINQLNSGGYGIDEMLIQMLHISDFLEMPGHFTNQCLEQGKTTDFISRMSQWFYGKPHKCGSGVIRHSNCILGIEDIPTIAQFPNIVYNKMMPSFDISAIDCLGELLHNRTFFNQIDHILEEDYYSNMVNVIYHKHHLEPDFKLDCTPSYQEWTKRKYPI